MEDDIQAIERTMSDLKEKFILSCGELLKLTELEAAFDKAVGPRDKRHTTMMEHFPEQDVLTVYWAYEYDVDLSEIKTPNDVVEVVCHLAEKGWPHCTASRLSYFAKKIYAIKGWNLYRFNHENESPPAFHEKSEERKKMTPQIRYKIIRRDGYRCRACGFAVQDGARLHVDHIKPVSKGGKTEAKNLQTLCAACNLGKANQ